MALDPNKLRERGLTELEREEAELREEIWKLRLQRSTGKLQDAHKVRRTRQDLARVLTIRHELESGTTRPGAAAAAKPTRTKPVQAKPARTKPATERKKTAARAKAKTSSTRGSRASRPTKKKAK